MGRLAALGLVCACLASPAATYVTALTDRPALKKLEGTGLGLGARLGDPRADSTSRLARLADYRALVKVLTVDLQELEKKYRRPAPPAKGPGTFFPPAWLRSPAARFELVGIVNRLDRRSLIPDSCGELRLVYRLAYETTSKGRPWASRLPMTLNLVYRQPDDGHRCRERAAAWTSQADPGTAPFLEWLTGKTGPLRPILDGKLFPMRLEANLQAARWSPNYRPDLAGHADYLLRSFGWSPKRELVALPLENTPDVERFAENPELGKALLKWLRDPETLRAIDRGTALLPERFAAKRALSATPLGLSRRANRPFRALVEPGQLSGIALDRFRLIRSPEALLRRLDTLSCVGCHQSRAVAGFHLLGEDPPEARGVNGLRFPGSSHFLDEQRWREAYGEAVRDGRAPDEYRRHAELGEPGAGGYGARCGTKDSSFTAWTCGERLTCRAVIASSDDEGVGECLPLQPSVGDPCEGGRVTPRSDPHQDRLGSELPLPCPSKMRCSPREIGFPEGMCVASCEALPEGGICQRLPDLTRFTDCIAKGSSFTDCFVKATLPGGLRACSRAMPCRDDYLCAATARGEGACVPPYFLFQLVIESHPLPKN